MDENTSDDEGQWKDRYLDIINSLEAKQADAEASLDLMRRYLKRWAEDFAAEGESFAGAQWDGATLSNPTAARQFLDSIETCIRPEQLDTSQTHQATQAWIPLLNLLDEQKLARSLRQQVKQFKKHASEGDWVSPFDDFQTVLKGFIEQQSEQGERRGGLWQRLRKANAMEEAQTHHPDLIESEPVELESDQSAVAFAEVSPRETNAEVLAQGLDVVRRKINGILYTLIDQVKVPEAFDGRKDKLRSDLNDVADWEALPDILSETTSLVFVSNTVYQHEFEGFLQGLNAKLAEIQRFLSESRDIEENTVQAAEELDTEVKSTIDGLHAVLETSDDLNDLKKNVQLRLDKILLAFDRYHAAAPQPKNTVLETLSQLSKRMEALENDSQRLRGVIERQRQDSLKDTLTGLPNRQCYEEQGSKEIARVRRHGHDLSLVVADIDHFKSINDQYGHLAGDRVLKLVSQAMVNRLRTSDLIARYGGEEFVILMPDTKVGDAVLATDQLRAAIEKTKFHYQNQRVKITVSFGVTQVDGNDTLEKAFCRSDKALYEAKSGGRNCVKCAGHQKASGE